MSASSWNAAKTSRSAVGPLTAILLCARHDHSKLKSASLEKRVIRAEGQCPLTTEMCK